MSRRAVAGAVLAALGALIAFDLSTSAPLDPFTAPPLLALGSGQATSGAHCTALPGR